MCAPLRVSISVIDNAATGLVEETELIFPCKPVAPFPHFPSGDTLF
jgi:hypothetical protein